MAKFKFNYYCDSGHGWVKVERQRLHDLGILNDISNYSYQRNDIVYLEEDSDLETFLKAMRLEGHEVSFKQSHTNKKSKIRSYLNFTKGE